MLRRPNLFILIYGLVALDFFDLSCVVTTGPEGSLGPDGLAVAEIQKPIMRKRGKWP